MIRLHSSLWRLALMILGILSAALVLMLGLTTWALNRSLDVVARTVVEDDLGEYEVLYERRGVKGLERAFAAGSHNDKQMMLLVGPGGEVLTASDLPGYPDAAKAVAGQTIAVGQIIWAEKQNGQDGSRLLLGGLGLSDGCQLWFGRTDQDDRALIQHVQRLIWVAALITALLATAPILWFANQVLNPVRSLIRGAYKLAEGDRLDRRLEAPQAIPELVEFATAFNAGLDRVAVLTAELEAANDQLAHELRTPLARIRGNMEAVLAKDEPEAIRDSAVRGIEEIERAVSLVQTILSIRAGDARSMRLHLEFTCYRQLISDIVELYQAAAEARGIELSWASPDIEVALLMDQQRIRQAISNLLDNALAYTPAGGKVTVTLEVTETEATLRVLDSGPGLSENDHQRIWRRFSRGSAASATTPGIGLGLSLVRAVANVHHGEADGRNRPEGGAEFWIRLPVTKPAT